MRILRSGRGCTLFLMSIAAAFFNSPSLAIDPTEATQSNAYTAHGARPSEKGDFDLAKLEALGRVVYVSSGAIALSGRTIDNDTRTVFRFSGSDLHPTLIVELAQSEPLHRVSAVFDGEGNTKLDAYLLSGLPTRPGDLTHATPLACLVDRAHVPAAAAAEFAPNTARYVAFRWTREKSTRNPFVVAEVGAFCTRPSIQFLAIFAETEVHFTGEKGPDFSNQLGTIADPPGIAVVSP